MSTTTLKSTATSPKTLLQIGLLANAFEWYEFSVFNFSALWIGQLFFQSDYPMTDLLRVFTVSAMTYFARPAGSLFFGFLGDRRGRRYALRLSLLLMTVPTVLIGLLPTYAQAGIGAPILLVLLRLIQGFAMGGELPATACYVFEASPKQYRSLLCSAVGAAPKIGLLLGSFIVYLLSHYLHETHLLAWGWRIPFLLGFPLTLFIAYIRHAIQETADFNQNASRTPAIFTSLHLLQGPLLQALLLCVFLNVGYPILTLWMPFYLTYFLQVPPLIAQLTNTLTLCAMVPLCLGAGYISQWVGSKKLFKWSLIANLILILPLFKGLEWAGSDFTTLLALQILFALLVSIGQGVFFELVNEIFPPQMRSLGVSLACILPAAVVAGTIPVVCSYVLQQTHWLLFPAVYIMMSCLVALPALSKLSKKAYPDFVRNQYDLG